MKYLLMQVNFTTERWLVGEMSPAHDQDMAIRMLLRKISGPSLISSEVRFFVDVDGLVKVKQKARFMMPLDDRANRSDDDKNSAAFVLDRRLQPDHWDLTSVYYQSFEIPAHELIRRLTWLIHQGLNTQIPMLLADITPV